MNFIRNMCSDNTLLKLFPLPQGDNDSKVFTLYIDFLMISDLIYIKTADKIS